jgi:hypothetical protein
MGCRVMKVRTVGELCERLREDPASALGARSPRTLESYLAGYATALEHHHVAQLVDETGHRFSEWANRLIETSEEHQSRLNAGSAFFPESIALLNSEDEHTAFDTFLDLRARCVDELGKTASKPVAAFPGDRTLLGLLATVRMRPGMYFGDTRVEHCWALINGYSDAESQHGVASVDTAKLKRFQAWVDERYPFGRGHHWFRVFRLLAIDPKRGCEVFFGELDLFLAGDPPDAPDPAMTRMLAAILEKSRGS